MFIRIKPYRRIHVVYYSSMHEYFHERDMATDNVALPVQGSLSI